LYKKPSCFFIGSGERGFAEKTNAEKKNGDAGTANGKRSGKGSANANGNANIASGNCANGNASVSGNVSGAKEKNTRRSVVGVDAETIAITRRSDAGDGTAAVTRGSESDGRRRWRASCARRRRRLSASGGGTERRRRGDGKA
jgi:hypothetical protein